MDGCRYQYMHALRDRAPALFKRLSMTGQLEKQAAQASKEAEQLLRDLLNNNPNPSVQETREAEEHVRAAMLEFPSETTDDEDEMAALLETRPLASSGKITLY